MKIACNYSLETERLVDEKAIEIDYFKYPGMAFHTPIMEDLDAFEGFCGRLTAKRPMVLHGLYPAPHDLSSETLQYDFDLVIANRLIKMTKTPGLSFHPTLKQLAEDVPFEDTFATIVHNAKFIKEKYAHMDYVAIENLDGRRWGDLIKPDVITRLVGETGCDFLLNISHAYCASRWLGIPFFEYLQMLPLEKTAEIHINGWIAAEGTVMCHIKINEEGYCALREVLQHCEPKVVTVEYGRDVDRLGAGIPLLSEHSINEEAKNEIAEQVYAIRRICEG